MRTSQLPLISIKGVRTAVVYRVQGADLVARVRQERGDHLEVPDHDQGRGAARPHREGPLHGNVARRLCSGESPVPGTFINVVRTRVGGLQIQINWLIFADEKYR